MNDADWLTLRELDQRHGRPKGSAFRAFKAALPGLREGVDFVVLAAADDAARIEPLRRAGRVYPASRNVVLLAPAAAARLDLMPP